MVLSAVALLSLIAGPRQQDSAADLYKRVLPSVMTLTVQTNKGTVTGTAFITNKKGIAATAWHVMNGALSAQAKFSDGQEYDVSGIVDKDEKRDIVLIRVKVADRIPLPLADFEPQVGDHAYAIGSPEGMNFSFSEGIVSQIRELEKRKLIQFTTPASPGSSGGPLFTTDGKVIGLVDSQITEGQNLNFAVPIAYVSGLDDTLPTQPLTSVVASNKATAKVFDPERYGVLIWDGTRYYHVSSPDNWWKWALLYREGAPVTVDNVMIGIVSYVQGSNDKTVDLAISLAQAYQLRNYIQEFLDKSSVKALPKGRMTVRGTRWVLDGRVFAAKQVEVDFTHRDSSLFHNRNWSVNFKFDGGTRTIDKRDVKTLFPALDQWFELMKEDGLDVSQLPPPSN